MIHRIVDKELCNLTPEIIEPTILKKSKESAKIPVHLAFKWDGIQSNNAYFFFDPTFINSEVALNVSSN